MQVLLKIKLIKLKITKYLKSNIDYVFNKLIIKTKIFFEKIKFNFFLVLVSNFMVVKTDLKLFSPNSS